MWSVERVKEELPEVRVQVESGNLDWGVIRGRMLPYAWVELRSDGRKFEFAWETIAQALTNGRALRI